MLDVPELGRRDAAAGAFLERAAGGGPAVRDRPPARVGGHVEQVEALRQEPFAHVRPPDRPLDARPQAHPGVHGPVGAHAEGVGLPAVVVVGVPVGPVQHQLLRVGGVVHQRDARLDEDLGDLDPPVDRFARAALAGAVAAAVGVVGVVPEALAPVLCADHHVRARGRERRPDPVGVEVPGEMTGHDRLAGGSPGEQGQRQVVQHRRRHPALPEDVPGHAAGVGAVQRRPADDLAGGRLPDRIEGPPDPRDRQIVQVFAFHVDVGALVVEVVPPAFGEVAPHPEHAAEGRVADVVLPGAALDVPAADEHRLLVVRRQPVSAAQRVELLGGQERVAATQRVRHEEGAGGRDLGHRPVVHEHELGVGLGAVAEVVGGEQARRPALVRTLEVVERAVVVGGAVAGHEPVALDLVVEALLAARPQQAEVRKGAPGLGGRAGTPGAVGAQGARAVVPAALQDRLDVAVRGVDGDVAPAAAEAGPRDQRGVRDVAVPDRPVGGLIAGLAHDPLPAPVAVAVLVLAELVLQLHALEVVEQAEVHNTRDGVRPVGGRGAAGQHVDGLDQRARDLVDVRADAAVDRRAGREAAAVDQHQRAGGAQAPEIERGRPGRAVRLAGTLAHEDLREVAERILHPDGAPGRQRLCIGPDQRTGAGQVGPLDPGPRDDHLLELLQSRAGPGGLVVRRQGGGGVRQQQHGHGRPAAGSQERHRHRVASQRFESPGAAWPGRASVTAGTLPGGPGGRRGRNARTGRAAPPGWNGPGPAAGPDSPPPPRPPRGGPVPASRHA